MVWVATVLTVLMGTSCVTRDHRKLFSELRRSIDRGEAEASVEKRLLQFTPLGTPQEQVLAYLNRSLKKSAELHVISDPPRNAHRAPDTQLRAGLWVRYVGIFGHFTTNVEYSFDAHRRLSDIRVYTADCFF